MMESRGKKLRQTILVLLLLNFSSVVHGCDTGFIGCNDRQKCVNINYICDGDHDCFDGSDEVFCSQWNTDRCSRGSALCHNDCVRMTEYCQKVDRGYCAGVVDPRICQILKNGRLQRIENVVLLNTFPPRTPPRTTTKEPTPTTVMEESAPANTTEQPIPLQDNLQKSEIVGKLLEDALNITVTHPDCPKPFTIVGEHCLSLFFPLKVGWGEAKAFCEAIGGHLISFSDDAEDFISLLKYLQDIKLTTDFWIGGRYLKDTKSWKWLSEENMDMGSPFWAVRYNDLCVERGGVFTLPYWFNKTACYHYQQAPKPNTNVLCVAITYRHYYYMTDEDCLTPKSPLCLYNESLKPSSSTLGSVLSASLLPDN